MREWKRNLIDRRRKRKRQLACLILIWASSLEEASLRKCQKALEWLCLRSWRISDSKRVAGRCSACTLKARRDSNRHLSDNHSVSLRHLTLAWDAQRQQAWLTLCKVPLATDPILVQLVKTACLQRTLWRSSHQLSEQVAPYLPAFHRIKS